MELSLSQRETFSLNTVIKTLQIPEAETKFQRFKKFMKDVIITAKNKIVDFVKGFYQHAESVAVLTLASLGAAALIGELPFWMALPWWIEGPMVIPVLSVLLIIGLINLGEYRTKKRLANV